MKDTKVGALRHRKVAAVAYQRQSHEQSIPKLLTTLAELEKATRPQDGPLSARGKDRKAVKALNLVNQLVRAAAGWAIDHQIGLALHGLGSVDDVLPELGRHPLLAVALAEVDDHQHEVNGTTDACAALSDLHTRQALRNLLRTNPGAFPRKVTLSAVAGLDALDYNEAHPIFRPVKARRKIGLPELHQQLTALMWVEHYVGRGYKTYEAEQQVGDAFGVMIATLRSWKRRVRKELGALRVDNALENAYVSDHKYHDTYDAQLVSDGKSYRALLRQKK
jgi:hypothetical protein